MFIQKHKEEESERNLPPKPRNFTQLKLDLMLMRKESWSPGKTHGHRKEDSKPALLENHTKGNQQEQV